MAYIFPGAGTPSSLTERLSADRLPSEQILNFPLKMHQPGLTNSTFSIGRAEVSSTYYASEDSR